jgi:hypothetical protein
MFKMEGAAKIQVNTNEQEGRISSLKFMDLPTCVDGLCEQVKTLRWAPARAVGAVLVFTRVAFPPTLWEVHKDLYREGKSELHRERGAD